MLGVATQASLLEVHGPSAVIGLVSLGMLVAARYVLPAALRSCGLSVQWTDLLGRLFPLLVILLGTVFVAWEGLDLAGVRTVGPIPAGLPDLAFVADNSYWRPLLLPALSIGFMVFLSSQSAAQTLAHKRNERLATNRKLLGLGAANLASALSGGFTVTGSISRSAVNHAAGANTPLAGLITAALVSVVLCIPNGWLALLPLPAMAATIVMAVAGMVDVGTLLDSWRHDRSDALAWLATLAGVLLIGVEEGVVLGVLLSLASLVWRSSRPHIAVVGRLRGSGHFRNVERHSVETLPGVLFLRIDSAMVFSNTERVVERVENELRLRPQIRHLVLVMSAVNMVDTTALYALTELTRQLRAQGRCLHLCEIKGPVMDRLRSRALVTSDLSGKIFLSAEQAFTHLATIA